MRGVYAIINIVNPGMYVGQSINIRARFSKHRSALRSNVYENAFLQRSWNKYGEDAFEYRVLCVVPDGESLTLLENACIQVARWGGLVNVFNVREAADSNTGVPCSAETKRKISEANSGEKHPLFGTRRPDGLRARQSVLMLGNRHALGSKHTDEWKIAQSRRSLGNRHALGLRHTDEAKKAISKGALGRKFSPESIARRWITRRENGERAAREALE